MGVLIRLISLISLISQADLSPNVSFNSEYQFINSK